jgi:hypothetical protein
MGDVGGGEGYSVSIWMMAEPVVGILRECECRWETMVP